MSDTAPSKAEAAQGIYIRDNSGNDIAEIIEFSGFGETRDVIEVTSHDSSGNAVEKIMGMFSAPDLTMTCNFVPHPAMTETDNSGQYVAIKDFLGGTRKVWVIHVNNTDLTTFTFAGFVSNYRILTPLKGQIQLSITMAITGKPTLANY